ncbi:thioredoxin [Haloimpatiens massiliensis]|uniref:thioredoxin n=1 Tax=Haloimpatiens massiliensis TaxID=1658110 RepID=UPI000C856186|nr:thioredoxin [Haloimpatiens massiliensis]
MVKEISSMNFNTEVMEGSVPVVVDFWATWCGPCRMLGPVIEDVSNELSGKAKFVKVNVDENPDIAQKYGIASIPTVMVFKSGSVVGNMVGFRPKNEIMKILESHI